MRVLINPKTKEVVMKLTVFSCVLTLLFINSVQAQQIDPTLMIHEQFTKIDTNSDGEISQEELVEYKLEETKKVTAKIFEKLDTDKNGTISEEEYSQTVANIVNQLKKMSEGLQK